MKFAVFAAIALLSSPAYAADPAQAPKPTTAELQVQVDQLKHENTVLRAKMNAFFQSYMQATDALVSLQAEMQAAPVKK